MLGIPRPDLPIPPAPVEAAPPTVADAAADSTASGRPRAHVRYDSVLESPLAARRRKRFFVVCGALVALSAAWLIYRFVNG